MRTCEICGDDISGRLRSDSIYCKECYKKLNRERSFERTKIKNRFDRSIDWENRLGTTDLSPHTSIKEVKGKLINIDKEYRIIRNELRKLSLK